MKFDFIKKLYRNTPYCIKKIFAPTIRNKLISNKIFLKQYEALNKYENMSDEDKEKLQLKKLKEVLEYSYNYSKYYHELFDEYKFDINKVNNIEDIRVLPLLTKDILQEKLSDIVTDNIDDYYTVTTGGTTGIPTTLYMHNDTIFKEWAFVYHYWSKFGYDYRTSRIATFRDFNLNGKISEINPIYSELRMNLFVMNEYNINEYIKQIDDYGVEFLYGYPSAIYNFCRICEKNKIQYKIKIKAVFLISENLYEFQEKLITRVLKCPIAMFYGHTERTVFAERNKNGYSSNNLYGVLEVDKDGSPIATGFINPKTPLIRYKIDDEIKVNSYGCYDITGHRDDSILYGKNGEQISITAFEFSDTTFNEVSEFQIVQNENGKAILKVVSNKVFCKEYLDNFSSLINKKIQGAIIFDVVQVDHIKYTKRGKYKILIQNCKME